MSIGKTGRRKTPIRTLGLLSVLGAALAALVVALLPASSATAHGVAMQPGSRTYLCYKDMLASGNQTASNPACAAAIAQSGTTPLYNWFAVLDSNAAGRTQGYIPDGTICSAGGNSPYDFSAYDAPRADWPATNLQAGSTITIQYSNWAAHPGDFDVYLTRPGYSPTQPLGWGDLELIGSVTNPPQSGGAGSDGGHYSWQQSLPGDRSGRHIMMIHWIRSDSNENFYSCSDVVF